MKDLYTVIFSLAALILISFTYSRNMEGHPHYTAGDLEQFAVSELVDSLKASGRPYLPFLTRSTLRCGIYRLPAGAADGQAPHELDEVYYVLKGKCRFKAGEQDVVVQPGDVLFVAAKAVHQFYDIEEDLELLVFFSTKAPE